MSKRILIVFTTVIILLLAACGGGDDQEQQNQNNENQTNQQDEGINQGDTDTNQNNNNHEQQDENEQNNEEQDQQQNNQDQAQTGSIGDTLEFNGLQITLNDAYTSQGSDWETPSNDQYLILDLTIENPTDESENVSTLLQMAVQDEDGYTYDVTIFTETKGSLDGEVGPGRNLRGEVAFDVDESSTYEFIFDDPFASGQAIWTINLNE